MLDKIAETSLLYDFYGELLSKRQRDVMALYHEENLSLGEIAEEFSISRQGVHDALKNAQRALQEYEEKLGLVEKFENTRTIVRKIDSKLSAIIEANITDRGLVEGLEEIRTVIDGMEE